MKGAGYFPLQTVEEIKSEEKQNKNFYGLTIKNKNYFLIWFCLSHSKHLGPVMIEV